jgi:mono/diheme cytochrome c family protein
VLAATCEITRVPFDGKMVFRAMTAKRFGGILFFLCVGSFASAQEWEIPRGAATTKSPLSPTPTLLGKGKALYNRHCVKCHGPDGKGDGPDKTNDLAHPPADLTSTFRATFNPEGVMFYKIWNGRGQPTMPAFKTQLTDRDVWTIVEYVKTLRNSSGGR